MTETLLIMTETLLIMTETFTHIVCIHPSHQNMFSLATAVTTMFCLSRPPPTLSVGAALAAQPLPGATVLGV